MIGRGEGQGWCGFRLCLHIIRIDSEDLPSHDGREMANSFSILACMFVKESGGSAGAGDLWEEGRTRSASQEEENPCFCLAVFSQLSPLRLWL